MMNVFLFFYNRPTYSSEKKKTVFVKEANCHQFKVYDCSFSEMRYCDSAYAHDDRNVYYQGRIIKEADLSSFNVLTTNILPNPRDQETNQPFAVDKNHVYFLGQPTQQDVVTFKEIGNGYFRDKDHIYYLDRPLDKADPNHFEQNYLTLYSNHFLYSKELIVDSSINAFNFYSIYYPYPQYCSPKKKSL